MGANGVVLNEETEATDTKLSGRFFSASEGQIFWASDCSPERKSLIQQLERSTAPNGPYTLSPPESKPDQPPTSLLTQLKKACFHPG
jgi:hypothetical protein